MRPSTPQRLFLALWPAGAIRDRIWSWQQSWHWPDGAKLVAREQLHLTLHFIGNVASERLPELVNGLRVPFDPVALDLGEGGVWPGGIAVLRPRVAPAALDALHARLGQALTALQLPVEPRPFRAHVTLARKASGAAAPTGDAAIAWRVADGYVLVRSLPGGAGYEVLERFNPP